MHTLSIFPRLLDYGLLAPLLLRLVASLFVFYIARERYKKSEYKISSFFYIVPGAFLFLGLYTQIGAVLGMFAISFEFWAEKKVTPPTREKLYLYIAIKIILLSLLFTGPGFLAFDLPL